MHAVCYGYSSKSTNFNFHILETSDRIKKTGIEALRVGKEVDNWDSDFLEDFASKRLVPTPPGTPLSDLYVFNEAFSGPLPLNGICEKDFNKFNDLLVKIQAGKTQLKIEGTSFFQNKIHTYIKQLFQTHVGRELFEKLLLSSLKTPPIYVESGHCTELTYDDNYDVRVKMQIAPATIYMLSREFGTFRKILVQLPLAATFAHELVHLLHFLEGGNPFEKLPPTLDQAYATQEEQLTITGLAAPVPFDFQAAKRAELIHATYGSVGLRPNKNSYEPINENRIALSLNHYYRVTHKAMVIPEKRIENGPEITQLYQALIQNGFNEEAAGVQREICEVVSLHLNGPNSLQTHLATDLFNAISNSSFNDLNKST